MSWIEHEIASRGGAVSFRTFMELALFDETHGYYLKADRRQGRSRDYLTAPSASTWYAAVLTRFALSLEPPLRIVDVGSADGRFLAGLHECLEAEGLGPGTFDCVSIERSPALRQVQRERFAGQRVAVLPTVRDMDHVRTTTLIHASELYDAFPVHRVVQRSEGLLELGVRIGDGDLEWTEMQPDPAVVDYLGCHRIVLEPGQIAEVNLDAGAFHLELLKAAGQNGAVIVVDYGYPARRLYDPRGRRGGSLACFFRHTLNRDPLARVGEQDMTAHVNWDDLRRAAAHSGWTEIGLWPLAELLIRTGLPDLVEDRGFGPRRDVDAESYGERQEIKRLLDPEGMGTDLKALVQAGPDAVNDVRRILDSAVDAPPDASSEDPPNRRHRDDGAAGGTDTSGSP